jgi:tetratricopeptide (TPR) repeat protein
MAVVAAVFMLMAGFPEDSRALLQRTAAQVQTGDFKSPVDDVRELYVERHMDLSEEECLALAREISRICDAIPTMSPESQKEVFDYPAMMERVRSCQIATLPEKSEIDIQFLHETPRAPPKVGQYEVTGVRIVDAESGTYLVAGVAYNPKFILEDYEVAFWVRKSNDRWRLVDWLVMTHGISYTDELVIWNSLVDDATYDAYMQFQALADSEGTTAEVEKSLSNAMEIDLIRFALIDRATRELALAWQYIDRSDKALEVLARARAPDTYPGIWLYRAVAQNSLGLHREALASASRFVSIVGASSHAFEILADSSDALGDEKAARQYREKRALLVNCRPDTVIAMFDCVYPDELGKLESMVRTSAKRNPQQIRELLERFFWQFAPDVRDEGYSILMQIAEEFGDNTLAQELKARRLLTRGATDEATEEAIELLEELVQSGSGANDDKLTTWQEMLNEELSDRREYARMLEIPGNSVAAIRYLHESYIVNELAIEWSEDALNKLENALRPYSANHPGDYAARYLLAVCAGQRGNRTEAATILKTILEELNKTTPGDEPAGNADGVSEVAGTKPIPSGNDQSDRDAGNSAHRNRASSALTVHFLASRDFQSLQNPVWVTGQAFGNLVWIASRSRDREALEFLDRTLGMSEPDGVNLALVRAWLQYLDGNLDSAINTLVRYRQTSGDTDVEEVDKLAFQWLLKAPERARNQFSRQDPDTSFDICARLASWPGNSDRLETVLALLPEELKSDSRYRYYEFCAQWLRDRGTGDATFGETAIKLMREETLGEGELGAIKRIWLLHQLRAGTLDPALEPWFAGASVYVPEATPGLTPVTLRKFDNDLDLMRDFAWFCAQHTERQDIVARIEQNCGVDRNSWMIHDWMNEIDAGPDLRRRVSEAAPKYYSKFCDEDVIFLLFDQPIDATSPDWFAKLGATTPDMESVTVDTLWKGYFDAVVGFRCAGEPGSELLAIGASRETLANSEELLPDRERALLHNCKFWLQIAAPLQFDGLGWHMSPTSASHIARWIQELKPVGVCFNDGEVLIPSDKALKLLENWGIDSHCLLHEFSNARIFPRGSSGFDYPVMVARQLALVRELAANDKAFSGLQVASARHFGAAAEEVWFDVVSAKRTDSGYRLKVSIQEPSMFGDKGVVEGQHFLLNTRDVIDWKRE